MDGAARSAVITMDVVLVSVELAIAIIISLWLTSKGEYVCEEGAVRLVDPDEPSDNWSQNLSGGRVEICNDDQWKTVCDYKWHNREAQVVCRQLGYSNVSNNGWLIKSKQLTMQLCIVIIQF